MDNPQGALHIEVMGDDTDILIVGGGLNGPLLALALSQFGFTATVVDALPAETRAEAGFDGRSYAVALTSCRMLRSLGLWDSVADQAQAILDIKVSDGRAGEGASPFFMHFSHAEIEEGPMGHMIEDRHLRGALMEAMAASGRITHLAGQRVVSHEVGANGVSATLEGGQGLKAALLVGADGRQSAVAARAGIRRTGWGYGQTALVAATAHERAHEGIAHQFFMPEGPLAILPLRGNRSSIVWSEKTRRAEAFHTLSEKDYLTMLRPRFGDFLGEISLAGQRFTYPLSLSLATRMVADRVALVGDAAHGVHPIAGQGLNAGFRDIAALVEVLSDARRRGEDVGSPSTLSAYESWRRFDNTALAMATDGFNRLFSNDNPFLRAGRDLGMGLINRTPRLRRGFIREAAGLTGTLPSLMQG